MNNSPSSIIITYLRTLAMELNGGPSAMTELITEAGTPDNLEKIAQEIDMNVSHSTRSRTAWLTLLLGFADTASFICKRYKALDGTGRQS